MRCVFVLVRACLVYFCLQFIFLSSCHRFSTSTAAFRTFQSYEFISVYNIYGNSLLFIFDIQIFKAWFFIHTRKILTYFLLWNTNSFLDFHFTSYSFPWHCLPVLREWNGGELLPVLRQWSSVRFRKQGLLQSRSIPLSHTHTHTSSQIQSFVMLFSGKVFSYHFIPCRFPQPFGLPQHFPFSRYVMKILHKAG